MIKVSIVEDNFHYRSALVKLFQNADGFVLKGAYSSAEEAFHDLLMHQPDIVIIDIQLPGMSGISLIRKMHFDLPGSQFLVYTLYQDNDIIIEAMRAGASGYILKGLNTEDIWNAVKELYAGGVPLSPSVARKIISFFQQTKNDINSYGLSERELEVLISMSKGLLYKEIAYKLFISSNTVKNHLKSIYKKLHVQNKIEAINKYETRTPGIFNLDFLPNNSPLKPN
jgi:NarL family two-component system response regulator LiaR